MKTKLPHFKKPSDASAWIFSWRKKHDTLWTTFFALIIVSLSFALFFNIAKTDVGQKMRPIGKQAEVFQLFNNVDQLSLQRIAIELGPFPSRFDLNESPDRLSNSKLYQPIPTQRAVESNYIPTLRPWQPLPSQPEMDRLVSAQRDFLPKWSRAAATTSAPIKTSFVPTLSSLSQEVLPTELPPLPRNITLDQLPTDGARYLLKVASNGTIEEVFQLSETTIVLSQAWSMWFKKITLAPSPSPRWIAVDVSFKNQISPP